MKSTLLLICSLFLLGAGFGQTPEPGPGTGQGRTQNSYRLRDPQFFRLNFSWRFGKFDSLFKRKNNRADGEGNDDNAMPQ